MSLQYNNYIVTTFVLSREKKLFGKLDLSIGIFIRNIYLIFIYFIYNQLLVTFCVFMFLELWKFGLHYNPKYLNLFSYRIDIACKFRIMTHIRTLWMMLSPYILSLIYYAENSSIFHRGILNTHQKLKYHVIFQLRNTS